MKNSATLSGIAVILLAAAAGGAYYYWQHSLNKNEGQTADQDQTPGQKKAAEPAIRYPVPTPPESQAQNTGTALKPLPALEESDTTINEALAGVLGKDRIEALLNLKDFIQRMVVTVDNATGAKLPLQSSPVKPVEEKFRAASDLTIAPNNSERYTPYISMVEAADAKKLVAVYVHFYPLFQKAYNDLGNQKYFNDRLVEVINQLLETPQPKDPVKLTQYGAYFKYEDPQLEALSAGQKILVRVGPANASRIKAVLRNLQGMLTHLGEKIPR